MATAVPLCEGLRIKIQARDGLQEIGYGLWEGKTVEQVNQNYHDDYVRWLADPGWNAPSNGEKGIEIARRSSMRS